MAQVKSFFPCFLLVAILFQELKSDDGRHLMLRGKREYQKLQISIKSLEKEARMLVNRNDNMHVDDESYKAMYGNEIADPEVFPPPPAAPSPPTAPRVASSTPAPPGRHADDFRPTTPGHSPGVGHSLQH